MLISLKATRRVTSRRRLMKVTLELHFKGDVVVIINNVATIFNRGHLRHERKLSFVNMVEAMFANSSLAKQTVDPQ